MSSDVNLVNRILKALIGLALGFTVADIGIWVHQQNNNKHEYQNALAAAEVRDHPCDRKIRSVTPPWVDNDYSVICVDEIQSNTANHADELKRDGWVVYALTHVDYPLIKISRSTPDGYLNETVVHEWVHADLHSKRRSRLQDAAWEKEVEPYLNDNMNGYQKEPDEILATNVARCSFGKPKTLNNLPTVPCETVWEHYPRYRWVVQE